MKLYDRDKQTLIAVINDKIELVNPTKEVNAIKGYELKYHFAFGYASDLTTFSDGVEHRWVKVSDNKYCLRGMTHCFDSGDDAAKFAVNCAMGVK